MRNFVRVMLATLAVLSVGLASCSNDDSSSTASATPSSTPSTTSAAAPSTSTPPSTSTSTSTSTTIAETTTTVDQIALTKEAVAAAAVQSRQDYLYAVQNYDAPDALSVLGRSTAANSPSFQLTLDNIENLRANGWRVRPNPSIPSDLTIEGDITLLDGPPSTKAELTACVIGAGVVFEPGAGPNGEDTIVNDEIVARRTKVTMVLEDGSWKLYTGDQIDSWNGQSTCPPE